MEMQPLLTSILIMAIIIGIGALIASRSPFTADGRQLMITIIVNVAMPCIILYGIFATPIDQHVLTQVLILRYGRLVLCFYKKNRNFTSKICEHC